MCHLVKTTFIYTNLFHLKVHNAQKRVVTYYHLFQTSRQIDKESSDLGNMVDNLTMQTAP